MSGAQKLTFYKRVLPSPPATAFSSEEGRMLFQEALQDGTMSAFFKLIEQFRTQSELAFCGLTSLVVVLNALSIDPRRTWKAPWRWFDETLLDCCKPLELVKQDGVSLRQVACLARCNGAKVHMHNHRPGKLDHFRFLVKDSCKSGEHHIIVSYSREFLKQTGTGHFSPIGGYHEKRDLVLILDTARFKYPPHWVPLETLFDAMAEVDPTTGAARGFMILRAPDLLTSVCYTLNLRGSWQEAENYIRLDALAIFKNMAMSGNPLHAILKQLVQACPLKSIQNFVAIRVSGCPCEGEGSEPVTALTDELHTLPFYQIVEEHLRDLGEGIEDEGLVGRVTVLLLLRTSETWLDKEISDSNLTNSNLARDLRRLLDLTHSKLVEAETEFLRLQWANLVDSGEFPNQNGDCRCCSDEETMQ